MKNVLKLKDSSKPAESKLKDDILELYMDYVGDDGYVYKHNGKEYYKTNISLQGPKGNPGPKGRDGYTPRIGENGNWYIAGTDTRVLSTPNLKVTETELKELVENKELVSGIIYSYNVQTPEETTITINQKAISGSKLETEGVISSNDENYDGKTVLYDITEEKLNIPSKGLVILIAYDNSKVYMYYDGVLENTYINRGPLNGQAEYTLFRRIDDRQFLSLNLSSTDYVAANSSQIPAKYDIHTCPRIKLSYDFDTHKDIITYAKNGNQIEIDTDSLKQLIAENKLEPGVEYVYKINDLFYETTIKQKAISNNKLDTKGKIVNVNCIVEHLNNSTDGINVKKYINSNVVFDIEKDFCLYFNDMTYLYIDGAFRAYGDGIVNYEDNWFKVDTDVNVNTLNATVVLDGGNSDFGRDDVIGEEDLINKTIIAKPLLILDCPANHISTVWIDQSYKEQNTVKITGDVPFDKVNGWKEHSSEYVNIIRWIFNNTNLYKGRYKVSEYETIDYAQNFLEVMKLNAHGTGFNLMKLPEFWWKSRNISEDVCQVDFCNDKKYIDDTWQHWDGNTFINMFKTHVSQELADNIVISVNGQSANLNAKMAVLSGETDGNIIRFEDMYIDFFFYTPEDSKPLVNLSYDTIVKKIMATMIDDNDHTVNDHTTDIPPKRNRISMVTYETHCIMAMLFYAFYGDVNSKKTLGKRGHPEYSNLTGNLHSGDKPEVVVSDNDIHNNCIYFWGLYDWWGNVDEWIDNLRVLGIHGSVGNKYYSNEDYGYCDIAVLDYEGKLKRVIHTTNYDEGSHKLILGEHFDLFPRADGIPPHDIWDVEHVTDNCGWTDSVYGPDGIAFVAYRGGAGSTSGIGIAHLSWAMQTYFNNYIGSRLQYHGAWTEVDSFE